MYAATSGVSDHRALVTVACGKLTVAQLVERGEVLRKIEGVNHRYQRIEAGEVAQAHAILVGEGEGLRYWQRLRDAGRLDQQVVEAALAC